MNITKTVKYTLTATLIMFAFAACTDNAKTERSLAESAQEGIAVSVQADAASDLSTSNDENLSQEEYDGLNPMRLDSVEQALEPYKHLDISLDRTTGLMMYDGNPVREVRDDIAELIITESAGPNGFGGRDISGAIDLTVVYENDSPIGFKVSTQEEYDRNTEERT